jgi:hypothetical protein
MLLTTGRSYFVVRAAIALALALMVHGVAWLTLAGIRVLLPGTAPSRPIIEAALLPPAQAPVALPARRAVARTATRHRGGVAPLQAVRTDLRSKPNTAEHAAVAAPAESASAPVSAPESTPQPPPSSAPAPPGTSDAAKAPGSPVARAAPTAPVEPAPLPQAAPAPSTPAAPEPAPPTAPAPTAANAPLHAPVQVVLPRSARLVYASYATVRAGGFVLPVRGRTTTRWQFLDGHYQVNLSIDVVNFSETSSGQFDPDFGLEPERYSETRPHRPISTTRFDWANHRVSFTEDQRQQEAQPGTQDRLSVQFQLSVLRQVYPDLFVRGTVVPILLAGTRDVSRWTFTVTGEDNVDSGLGHLPALRVLSNRTTASGDESLEVWISEKLRWFPVRIRMVDKNRNVLDFVLDEATID